MSKMKFEDVMNFYPKHNQSIFGKIVKAQKSGSLIPFVGAGMSAFCGYKLWGDVLRELADFIPIEDVRRTALEQIDSGTYEEAAQMILEAYPAMLDQLPDLISPSKIDDCPLEEFKASAAFALPPLFQKGLVMTTNFDRVLETAYLRWSSKAIRTVTPNQQDCLAQLRQNQSLGLFKLHGDIGSEAVSIDDLVFTREQYEKKYADGSPLVQELTRWFENRRLLFLGCSLNADRTMEVLKTVTQAQSGIRHYAILGCKKSDISKRLKELKDIGILPVFYDENNHDAVRVILERLLEETDQSAYRKLREAYRVVSATTKEEHRLLFDADYFPFTGRKLELASLEAFCNSDEDISWWAVTGPGGMGKSRLVYEFTNQRRKDGWQVERFEAHPSKDSIANSIEILDEWTPAVLRTIVVLDDVQGHMDLVKRWLNRVIRLPRSEKLRILLLEREGEDLNSSPWLGTGSCDDIPDEWCYDESFLYLKPMTDADLITIMDEYAAATGKKLNAELLLKTLERVDPELKRPMYAIAIADACCQGKDPTHWDRKQVLDTLLDRELGFHFNRFRGMTGKDATKTLRSELKDLLARSCVQGILFLDDAKIEHYAKLDIVIKSSGMDIPEFLEGLGVLHTVLLNSIRLDQSGKPIGEPLGEEEKKAIALSCPDLIKEHLVLNLAFEGGKKELLFPQGWEEDPGQLSFLNRLLADYSDRLKEQTDYWNTVFQAIPQNLFPAQIYGHILLGYTAYYSDKSVTIAVKRLAQLYDEMHQAPEIAVEYGNGLFNLTVSEDLGVCTEAVEKLDKLYQSHSDIPDLAVQLAKGLVNLTVVQDIENRTKIVMRLEKLYQSHPDISELVVQFAKGLVNLTVKQDIEDCAKTVMQLEKLYQSHSDIPELAVRLAKGLVNLTVDQDAEECAKAVMRLDELYKTHSDNSQVAARLIMGLGYLSNTQEFEYRLKNIARCEKIYKDHPMCEDVAAGFAGCLVDLALNQKSESEVSDTLARSKEILERYPGNRNIQLCHAKTWFNLTLQQCETDIPATVMDIVDFLNSHNGAIPPFQEALERYLSDHPDHKDRYQPLLNL